MPSVRRTGLSYGTGTPTRIIFFYFFPISFFLATLTLLFFIIMNEQTIKKITQIEKALDSAIIMMMDSENRAAAVLYRGYNNTSDMMEMLQSDRMKIVEYIAGLEKDIDGLSESEIKNEITVLYAGLKEFIHQWNTDQYQAEKECLRRFPDEEVPKMIRSGNGQILVDIIKNNEKHTRLILYPRITAIEDYIDQELYVKKRLKNFLLILWGIMILVFFVVTVLSFFLILRNNRNENELHFMKMQSLMNRFQTKNEELNREIASHKQTQGELIQYKKHLQSLVDKQTHELRKTNQSLEESVKNLKETQNQLIISEKLASLGSLVAGVSHEINTPVGSALTGITFLQDRTRIIKELYRTGELSSEDFEEYLNNTDEITRSVTISLKDTINLVQSLKQVSADQTSDRQREFNFKEYLEEIILSLKNILKKTDIKIIIDCPANLYINSVPGFYSQIFTNLIQNSIIHGYSEIKKGSITIKVVKQKNQLIVTYYDDGKGIPEEIENRIFDPFFTTARGQGGTGLGLNIIYTLVTDNLRGNIKYIREPEKGAGFKITIPIESE